VNGIIPRIVFQVAKHQDSSTALGVAGANKLHDKGSLLFKSQKGNIKHLQGSYVTKGEIKRILSSSPAGCENREMLEIKKPETPYLISTDRGTTEFSSNSKKIKEEKELAKIAIWTLGRETVSAVQIQKKFKKGSTVADEIIEKLRKLGIVGALFAKQPRKVIPVCFEDLLPETVAFLEHYGYPKEIIVEAFAARNAT
jgi:DNA segregation ATPase FtsK/SpoIIIE-like protein